MMAVVGSCGWCGLGWWVVEVEASGDQWTAQKAVDHKDEGNVYSRSRTGEPTRCKCTHNKKKRGAEGPRERGGKRETLTMPWKEAGTMILTLPPPTFGSRAGQVVFGGWHGTLSLYGRVEGVVEEDKTHEARSWTWTVFMVGSSFAYKYGVRSTSKTVAVV